VRVLLTRRSVCTSHAAVGRQTRRSGFAITQPQGQCTRFAACELLLSPRHTTPPSATPLPPSAITLVASSLHASAPTRPSVSLSHILNHCHGGDPSKARHCRRWRLRKDLLAHVSAAGPLSEPQPSLRSTAAANVPRVASSLRAPSPKSVPLPSASPVSLDSVSWPSPHAAANRAHRPSLLHTY
jgi:hypothetical protein